MFQEQRPIPKPLANRKYNFLIIKTKFKKTEEEKQKNVH